LGRIAYNCCVDKPAIPDPPARADAAPSRPGADRWRAWRAESIGLIVIVLAILLYTVLRYGAHISWSAR